MPTFIQWFEDTFQEADGPLNSSNWTAPFAPSDLCQILNQECTSNGIGLEVYSGSLASLLPADQWVSFQIAALNYVGGNGATVGAYVRTNNSFGAGYFLFIQRNADGVTANVSIEELVSPFNVIFQNPLLPVSVGDVFLLSAQGTTISVYQNGALLGSATSSTTSSPGEVGIRTSQAVFNSPGDGAMVNFQVGAFVPVPGAPAPETQIKNGVPTPVQIFGRLPSGSIAAVACDQFGNLAISGGSGGAINTVDLLGNDIATPCMIYGALQPSGEMLAVGVDEFGNLCATVGSGGGNPNTIVDSEEAAQMQASPVQIFARDFTTGKVIAVPLSSSNALYDSVNPGTTPATTVDQVKNGVPTPVIICGRTPAGNIVAVSLDSAGRLCIAGSGSSGSTNEVDVFENGQCSMIQIFGRTPSGVLQSVPLDDSGNLSLN